MKWKNINELVFRYIHRILAHELINDFYPFDIRANVVLVEVGNP